MIKPDKFSWRVDGLTRIIELLFSRWFAIGGISVWAEREWCGKVGRWMACVGV